MGVLVDYRKALERLDSNANFYLYFINGVYYSDEETNSLSLQLFIYPRPAWKEGYKVIPPSANRVIPVT